MNDYINPLGLSSFDYLGENKKQKSESHIEANPEKVKFVKRYERLSESGQKKKYL